ncbi:uncharacterized protein LOC132731528 [Ruditapes philippinarum]|uniref:uncharacterized protein LOC132731528 n=1 Tax=Ruditapes philippinarum TaxID=129788 RepID=UPI00295C0BB7|nr:uncharacterized protein LOC132731528 [Ruditapes philippinarum]
MYKKVEVFINVAGVNEFPPVFNNRPYNVTLMEYDGANYFNILASSKGDIILARKLNFDTMERSKLFLNLSVSDEPSLSPTAKTTYTTLEIQVTDVDDQPPYFDYPDCPPPCPAPPFLSIIRLNHKGPLSVTPDIKGKISDTLGTSLVYSIEAGK